MILCAEEIDEEEDDDVDQEDEMMIDEAESEEESEIGGADDKEEYETITISEAPNEQKYDEKLDLYEERQSMVKFKGKII